MAEELTAVKTQLRGIEAQLREKVVERQQKLQKQRAAHAGRQRKSGPSAALGAAARACGGRFRWFRRDCATP